MPKGQAASGTTNSWGDAKERRLLLLYGFKPGDWAFIAEKMGTTYSTSACSQKYAKLKRAIEAEFGGAGTSGASTPTKRARPATGGSAKKTKATNGYGDEGDDDGDSDDDLPNKKKANKKTKTDTASKAILKPDPSLSDIECEDLY